MKGKNMSEGILVVTKKDHDEMKANGIADESLLRPGKYKLRRRMKNASKDELRFANTKVEVALKLDLDVLKYLQRRVGESDLNALQEIVNKTIRSIMESEKDTIAVETRLLKDKKFIAALAKEVKKAA